jgi:hypothetical protein
MIDDVVARWHQHLRGDLPGGLDSLLHEDCVFFSPIVFSPQRGREVTKLYLGAAAQTFVPPRDGEAGDEGSAGAPAASTSAGGGFRYVKQVVSGNHAVLEFETTMGAVHVNGVDIITCDDDGLITEFKVMIRPLQAVNEVHARMKAMLEQMAPPGPA